MEKICKNCFHWNNSIYSEYHKFGICQHFDIDEDGDYLAISIESGYEGHSVNYIETNENFGCILFIDR